MSPTDEYKKLENAVTFAIVRVLRRLGRSVAGAIRSFYRTGRQRITIMLIPHSERKIFNFKISVFSLAFILLLLTVVGLSFIYFTTRFTGVTGILSTQTTSLGSAEASLESIRDEIYDLRKVASIFLAELNATRSTIGIQDEEADQSFSEDGDLASFFALREQDEGLVRELSELRMLTESMIGSVDMLKDVANVIESHREVMEDLPTLWPVSGRIRITNFFGFSEHPFSGETYLHKGIDIGKTPGAPILASANGKIIEKAFDRVSFGNVVMIQHVAGFYTKYGHLDQVYVKEGDTVVQGQQIGTMGNTGLSTGHHLHFEIRLGDQVKDPLTYLRLRDSVNVASSR